jgi:hypothetical protein
MQSPSSKKNDDLTAATARLGVARTALLRAQTVHKNLASKASAAEAEIKRLEIRAEETARALESARAAHKAGATQSEAWEAVADYATADVTLAEGELALAEARDKLARFRKDHANGGDDQERAGLEEAVARAEEKVRTIADETKHADKRTLATRAEGWLEEVRKAEAERRRLALIDQKLAQLKAAASRKDQERKSWSEREKKLGNELAKLDAERKKLESERKQLSART